MSPRPICTRVAHAAIRNSTLALAVPGRILTQPRPFPMGVRGGAIRELGWAALLSALGPLLAPIGPLSSLYSFLAHSGNSALATQAGGRRL